VTARGFGGLVVAGATTLHDADLKAVNTRDAQDRVKPTTLPGISVDGGAIAATLPPASWSVIRLAPA
jgi:alpha-N-arabinofuranosidase